MEAMNTPRPPESSAGERWPGPVVLMSADLNSKWGFGDGDIVDEHASWWREEMGLPVGHPYVLSREVLCDLIEQHVVPKLPAEQRAGILRVGGVHNPYRADLSVSGVVDEIEVVLDAEILEALQRLFPPRRPEEIYFIEVCERHWLPWRTVLPAIESIPGDILRLAAENLGVAVEESASPFLEHEELCALLETETTHALELARLACN